MTEPSPGPWYLFTNRHTDNGLAWGEVALKAHPAGGSPTVVPGMRIMWKGEQGLANAQLVVMAPDLLKAVLPLAAGCAQCQCGENHHRPSEYGPQDLRKCWLCLNCTDFQPRTELRDVIGKVYGQPYARVVSDA